MQAVLLFRKKRRYADFKEGIEAVKAKIVFSQLSR
jgi:hypothetical protein